MNTVEHKNCIICNGTSLNKEMTVHDFVVSKEYFDLYRCQSCKFLFTQNTPLEDNIGPYYQSEDYISHSDTTKGFINKVYHVVRDIMLGKKFKLIDKLSTTKNILDIGCGTGYFLNFMKGKQYTTLGVEPDPNAREHGKKNFGLNIQSNEALLNGEIKEQFNTISMWHVLEHVFQPDLYLKKIHQLLDDKGHLIVAVPNHQCYDAAYYKEHWAGYDVPIHLWHFSPDTMTRLANKNGFEIISMKRLIFDPFYIAMLSEKAQGSSFAFIKGVFVGLIATIKSFVDVKKSSSIIYVMKKK